MKKNLTITLAAALLFAGANAQIGGGLLNKAKSKANSTIDKATDTSPKSSGSSTSSPSSTSGSSTSSPAKSSSSSSSSSSKAAAEPAMDKNIPTNDLKKVIGDNDLYYSALLAQNVDSKIIVPKIVKEKDYMQEQWIPNAINVYQDPKGKFQFCYFALYEGMADPNSSFKIREADDAFRYKYKGIFWDGKSDYETFENMMYNRWASSYAAYFKNFVGVIKQADGSIIIITIPKKEENAKTADQEYVDYTELGYNPIANAFDFDAIEAEVLTKTEAAAKTADLAAARTLGKDMAKKALDNIDKKAKEDADKHIASITRAKRGMVNATYEKTMMDYLKANFKNEFKQPEYWEGATISSPIIIDTDWNIHKNDYGLIEYRSIACEVVIKNKGRCYVRSFVFAQDYAGGGNYSTKLYFNGFTSSLEQLPCDKAK